jgi:hypothetical protein
MIAGNKRSRHPLELYSERLAAIRWFERYHPDEFDLYGVGWDEYLFPDVRFVKGLNHIHALRRTLAPPFPSWKGTVRRKRDVMGQYRFALCYENVRDVAGYITEKLFDAFFAGCIPVYRGAPNVAQYLPVDSYVDVGDFYSFDALYQFMRQMDDATCEKYRAAAADFLSSDSAQQFSCRRFAETIIEGLSS